MSKLQELRDFVKQQFEQADPSDKNAIDTLAKINNSLEDVETEVKAEQDVLVTKNAELMNSYKELVKHTSFNDKSKVPTDQVGASTDFQAILDAALKQNVAKYKK